MSFLGYYVWYGLALLTLALAVLLNWLAPVPPLQDYNDWVYQGFILKSVLAGAQFPVVIKHWPVPYVFSQVLMTGMSVFMRPVLMARSFSTLYLLGAGTAIFASVRGDLRAERYFILICLVVINSAYWAGEINYQIGFVLVVLYVALRPAERISGILFDMLYLLLVFTCHAICLAILLVYVGFRSLSQRRIWQGAISCLPVLVLIAWYVMADHRTDNDPSMTAPALSGLREVVLYKAYVLSKIGPYPDLVLAGGGGGLGAVARALFCGMYRERVFCGGAGGSFCALGHALAG